MADRKKLLMKGGSYREPLSPISSNKAATRTPRRNHKQTACAKTPSAKTPSAKAKEGSTSGEGITYDRFIPNRAMMDNPMSHHLMMKNVKDSNADDNDTENTEYAEKMEQNLKTEEMDRLGARVLQMKIKPPQTKEGEVSMKLLYTKSKPTPAKFKSTRHVPTIPDKILDAPEIVDDYYLNLLDWGNNGLIAVPLYNAVYLWNSETGDVEELFGDDYSLEESVMITCVKWISEGVHIAVGLSNGVVELWDASANRRVRSMQGHSTRVGSLDWNEHMLTSGARSGEIHNHDVRIADHHTSSFLHHTQEICGLQWSPDGKLLASGGNDNTLNIWDAAMVSSATNVQPQVTTSPLHSLCEHLAAVKAVSWCPWQRNVLASGGGTLDRHIRIWNASSGACLQSHDSMAQISGILWSGTFKEIICSHGNTMSIWNYPRMVRETELTGHTGRILNIAMSPNGHLVASAGADETLRLWRCFEPDQKKTKPVKKVESRTEFQRGNIR